MPRQSDSDNTDDVRVDRFVSSPALHEFSQCLSCQHWQGNRQCAAFDEQKVPAEILTNDFDHRNEHPDDNGTTYEPKDGDTEHPMDRWQQSRPET